MYPIRLGLAATLTSVLVVGACGGDTSTPPAATCPTVRNGCTIRCLPSETTTLADEEKVFASVKPTDPCPGGGFYAERYEACGRVAFYEFGGPPSSTFFDQKTASYSASTTRRLGRARARETSGFPAAIPSNAGTSAARMQALTIRLDARHRSPTVGRMAPSPTPAPTEVGHGVSKNRPRRAPTIPCVATETGRSCSRAARRAASDSRARARAP